MTRSRFAYYAARAVIGFTRAVPDLVWALLFVTAVGLGPFPGGLALGVHSVGMLARKRSSKWIWRRSMRLSLPEHAASRCSAMASFRAFCRRCSGLHSIGRTRTSARRWCSVLLAPAASDFNY